MLERLHIQNYAIIDRITIDFSKGLSIITGETGAGKSILLGALGLIMGRRADTKTLYEADKKCIVEAVFSAFPKEAEKILQEEELDIEDQLFIRREISATGKSRSFINDTPVNLDIIQKLSPFLLDMHQQFDNLDIQEENFQMEMIDAFTKNKTLLTQYLHLYTDWKKQVKHLSFLEDKKQSFARESEFNRFLLAELDQIDPFSGEQEELENELNVLSNAQSIKEINTSVYHNLEENEPSVLTVIGNLVHEVSNISDISKEYQDMYNRLYSIQEECRDLAKEALRLSEQTELNPEKIYEIKERLNILYKLQKKHGVSDEAGLLDIWNQLRQKDNDTESLDQEINKTRKEISLLESKMEKDADILHQTREKGIPLFEKNVKTLLSDLKMDHAQLSIKLEKSEKFSENGKNKILWLFAANKGSIPQPLKSVASGGEISRLNLCIKSILVSAMVLPTIIFDEIDAGVSGDVALKMGDMLTNLAKNHQIISITHSPQVASKAQHHLHVFKNHEGDKTTTNIKVLSQDEKIYTLAIMLSSDPPTNTALAAAKELISLS
ncbi:MAG: DNA repair protein RecN [Saprospiraceae bacterium]|nr:DNA repair protein RecN [Saprospiraceae bacterium]